MLKRLWPGLVFLLPTLVCASDPPVVQQLRQALVGKQFELRIAVAGTACFGTEGLDFATTRLVDTEIDGSIIRYYMRADRFMNVRECTQPTGLTQLHESGYLDFESVRNIHQPGTAMTVTQVEAKDDRIELQLKYDRLKGDASYGKLKLMLGKEYVEASLEQIEHVLNTAFILPRIDEINSARRRYSAINIDIRQLESSLSSNVSAKQKEEFATKVLKLYQDQAGEVRRLNNVAFSPVPVPDTVTLTTKCSKMLSEFKQAAAAEELSSATREHDAAFKRAKELCDSLPYGVVRTRSELEAQQAAASTTKGTLSDLQGSHVRLLGLQPSSLVEDQVVQDKCGASLASLLQTFEAKEATVAANEKAAVDAAQRDAKLQSETAAEQYRLKRLDSTDDRYRQLKREQAVREGELVSALGALDEYKIYAQYRVLLESMIANRQEAQELGSRTAMKEIQLLTVGLQRLTR